MKLQHHQTENNLGGSSHQNKMVETGTPLFCSKYLESFYVEHKDSCLALVGFCRISRLAVPTTIDLFFLHLKAFETVISILLVAIISVKIKVPFNSLCHKSSSSLFSWFSRLLDFSVVPDVFIKSVK